MGPFGEAKAAMALSYGMRRPCLAPLALPLVLPLGDESPGLRGSSGQMCYVGEGTSRLPS